MESVVIQGVELRLTPPDEMRWQWVGRPELKRQLLAAWAVLDEQDHALSPRLVGKPGVGKTTLASAAARAVDVPLYVFQATMDTRPEDLLVTPVITDGQKVYLCRIVERVLEPEWTWTSDASAGVFSVQLADLDGDGVLEVVVNRYHPSRRRSPGCRAAPD